MDVSALGVVIAAMSVVPAFLILFRSAMAYWLARRERITRLTLERDGVRLTLDAAKPEDAEKIVRYFLSRSHSEELGPKE